AMEHARRELRPGMSESEAAALWQGHVHGQGTNRADVDLALPFSLVWSGPGIKTFTATSDLPVREDEPTLFEIWVCADGYWCDHTKNLCPGEPSAAYAELEQQLLSVYETLVSLCRPGQSLADLDRAAREAIAAVGYPGQPTHPLCHGVGARAHEPPYAHQAGGGEIGVRGSVIESPISDLKLDAIGVPREKMLGRITSAMAFAAEHGIHAAFFGVDSTRANPDFYERVYTSAIEAGARELCVVDT